MQHALRRLPASNDLTRARRTSGQPRTLMHMQQRAVGGRHDRHLKIHIYYENRTQGTLKHFKKEIVQEVKI